MSAVLDVATERLGRAWGAVSHLNAVADTPELRAAYNENLPKVTEFHTRLGADERLYAKYKAIAASPAAAALTRAAPQGAVERHARLRAVGRRAAGRGEGALRARSRSAAPSCRRSSPSTCSTPPTASRYYASRGRARRRAGRRASRPRATRRRPTASDGYKLTLHFPSYLPVMQYGDEPRAARDALHRLRHARQRARHRPSSTTAPLMRELLELRQEEAAAARLRQLSPRCRWCRRWPTRRRR